MVFAAVDVDGDVMVVKSPNPQASITVTAMYRSMNPPTTHSARGGVLGFPNNKKGSLTTFFKGIIKRNIS